MGNQLSEIISYLNSIELFSHSVYVHDGLRLEVSCPASTWARSKSALLSAGVASALAATGWPTTDEAPAAGGSAGADG